MVSGYLESRPAAHVARVCEAIHLVLASTQRYNANLTYMPMFVQW